MFTHNHITIFCGVAVVLFFPHPIHSRGVVSVKPRLGVGGAGRQFANEVPKFIAHLGDKTLIPELTVAAYDVAMLENVDFVEPDLVMTRDKVLVCHHDVTLRKGTDVSLRPEFATLMVKNVTLFLDGKNTTILDDWLISDFRYDQLKTLKVYQEVKGVRPQHFNGFFHIPTFQEYVDAVHKDTWRRMQMKPNDTFVMGMIPELKHPDYHNRLFHTDHLMETIFLDELRNNGYIGDDQNCEYNESSIPCSPLVVQCYSVKTIEYLSVTTDLRLLTLLDIQNLRYLTYQGMAELANKTEYLGIWKEHLYTGTQAEVDHTPDFKYDPEEIAELGGFVGPEDIVEYAHGMGMKVGIYTIYQSDETSFRGCAIQCVNDTKDEELKYYFDLGVDAFFVEGICESLRIRDKYFTSGSGAMWKGGVGKWTPILGILIVTVWSISMRL